MSFFPFVWPWASSVGRDDAYVTDKVDNGGP